MSRESEFLSRHKDDLKRAAHLCALLQRNVVEARPRELQYLELMAICKRLEGSARQMAHERGDDFTWISMGNHYYKMGELIRRLRRGQKWVKFGRVAEVFVAGISRIDTLATTATGRTSLNGSPLLLLPKHLATKVSPGGVILP